MSNSIKLLHWNINGIRAIMKKNVYNDKLFEQALIKLNSDILIFTETKISEDAHKTHDEVNLLFESYKYRYHTYAHKKGYSGVSVYSKIEPIKQIHSSIEQDEGRIIILEYDNFILISAYVPNSGAVLKRLSYRTKEWDIEFIELCKTFENYKPLIIAGDLNVAHTDIDIYKPENHRNNAGFTDDERMNFTNLLKDCKLIDTWRFMNPNKIVYTYFDYRSRARQRNAGWRIDYFLVSKKLKNKIIDSNILSKITGSDHIPIILTIDIM